MRRPGRVVRGVGTAASLVMFVATAVLWVRGSWFDEHVTTYFETRETLNKVSLWSYRNGFSFGHVRWNNTPDMARTLALGRETHWQSRPGGQPGWRRGFHLSPGELKWDFAGFAWIRNGTPERPWRFLVFPAWLPAAVFALAPARALRRWWRGRRRGRNGLCAVCGYDLRATPARCPECGTPAGKKAS